MTILVAIVTLLLAGGTLAAFVKRSFRLAVMFIVFALLLLGAAIFVIATMH